MQPLNFQGDPEGFSAKVSIPQHAPGHSGIIDNDLCTTSGWTGAQLVCTDFCKIPSEQCVCLMRRKTSSFELHEMMMQFS